MSAEAEAEGPKVGRTRLERPATVAAVHSVEQEEGAPLVYLAHLPSGPIVILRGTASLVWQEALDGPEDTLAQRVAHRLGLAGEESSVERDVVGFIDSLLAQGLLERSTASG